MGKISVYGGYGFVGGEFCRKYPEEIVRVPKHEVVPPTNKILYLISTTDNYNVFENVTIDIETNLIHLMEVLDACHKKYGNNFEFNFISSWFVLGRPEFDMVESFPQMEEANCHPKGFYSITKYAAEMLLQSYCETFKIKYRILRLANVLGTRDAKVSKKKNALQYLLDALVHNEDIELYEGGNFYRDYIDVRDTVSAIKLVMEKGTHPIYNISNGTSHRFRDLIEYAVKYSGSKSNVWDKLEKPEFHSVVQSKDVFLSNAKLKELGYAPEYSIEQTLSTIIDFYTGR
jgi:nucleoside-diphosphate-sugar epimerase